MNKRQRQGGKPKKAIDHQDNLSKINKTQVKKKITTNLFSLGDRVQFQLVIGSRVTSHYFRKRWDYYLLRIFTCTQPHTKDTKAIL